MYFLKVATFLLMALAVGAEKKIELQDIEEDNLRSEMRSEKEKELEKAVSPQTSGSESDQGFNSLDFIKNGLFRYFDNPAQSQQQRYIHQYAVTEQPERAAPPTKPHYAPQQAMVGYLSNFPMQIYLVPQYYSSESEQANNHPHRNAQYQPSASHAGVARVAGYQSAAAEPVQTQTNYIDVPAYVAPTGKTIVQTYAAPPAITYVTYPAQTNAPAPQATATPVLYQVPVLQYNSAQGQNSLPKVYYQNPEYVETNSVDEVHHNQDYDVDVDQKQYSVQTEAPYPLPTAPEFPRHYNSRAPIREEYKHHAIPELPSPNPLLIKASPPHLAHLPKTLPMYRPLTKPVYQGNALVPNTFTPRPHEHYGPPFKRRPTSLLDSYIPSSLQVEYLKRGLVKDPLAVYDALASGRLQHPIPRHYERGFLPNQMYHTAAGGVTYGHYKRAPKVEKVAHKL